MPSWLDGREDELIELVRAHGPNLRLIAQRMGTSHTALAKARSYAPGINARWHEAVREWRAGTPSPAEAWREARDAGEREVAALEEAFGWLRPVQLPAPTRRKCTYSASPVDVVLSDFHFPNSNPAAEAIALDAIKRLRPERVLLIGDLWDLMAYSKYDKEYRATLTWTPQDEAAAGAAFLHRLESIVSAWDGRIVALPGNHEDRWWRYLNLHASALVQHPSAAALLDFKRWWVPEWSRLEWSEEDIILPGSLPIVVTHGEIVRKHSGYSARAHGEKYHAGVIHGHTHRLGMSTDRAPAIAGVRADAWLDSYEIGCMCELQPNYTKNPNWHPGFCVVVRDEAQQSNAVELVKIRGERATIAALGGTVVA